MSGTGKKSIFHKIQKSPALLVFSVILLAVALFAVAHISSAVSEKNKGDVGGESTEKTSVLATDETTLSQENAALDIRNVKYYLKDVVSVSAEKTDSSVNLKVKFTNKDALLKTHLAKDLNTVQAVPYFCFTLKDGTFIKCPADVRLSSDGKTAVYSLTEIDDYANAAAITENITVNYANVLDGDFSLFSVEESTGSVTAILGTAEKTPDFNGVGAKANVTSIADGIKKVEMTKNDKFVWIDIYYTDVSSYMKLNNDFVTNFVCFGFEKDGVSYKRDFITTEYDSLNMVRCKFDSYSLDGLAKEMGVTDITVSDLFTDYNISVWTSDYDKDTDLFKIASVQ